MEIKKTPVQIPLTWLHVWLLFAGIYGFAAGFLELTGREALYFCAISLLLLIPARCKLDSDPENESTLAVSAWRNCGLRGDVSGSEIFLFPVQCAGGSGN